MQSGLTVGEGRRWADPVVRTRFEGSAVAQQFVRQAKRERNSGFHTTSAPEEMGAVGYMAEEMEAVVAEEWEPEEGSVTEDSPADCWNKVEKIGTTSTWGLQEELKTEEHTVTEDLPADCWKKVEKTGTTSTWGLQKELKTEEHSVTEEF